MKKLFKAVATLAAVGAAIGGIVYFVQKKNMEDDLDDFEEFDDFDDFDDFDEDFDDTERVYTSINLDSEEDAVEEESSQEQPAEE